MKDILLSQYHPKSELELEEHQVPKPKFPVINFHTHFWWGNWEKIDEEEVAAAVQTHKNYGVRGIVNLGSYCGESLDGILNLTASHREWFAIFGSVDVTKVGDRNFGKYASSIIEEGYKKGMRGLKFFKELGLHYRDSSGKLIRVDDKRLKPIWETAARLNIPVLIHIADPKAFFKPLDGSNERFEELNGHPNWLFVGDEFPSFDELMEMQENLLTENPDTTFVMAHVGCYVENLKFVSDQMDRHPNMNIDISARIAELGRQPYTARKFMIKYQDRILFGTDGSDKTLLYPYYYRFLETWDEYFEYGPNSMQGRWRIYGIGLPDPVLRKIYHENAIRLVPDFV